MRRPWRLAATVLFLLATLVGGLAGNRLLALGEDARSSLKLYTKLLEAARSRYGGEVHFRDLVYASINGMLQDPRSAHQLPAADRLLVDAGEAAGLLLRSGNPRRRAQRPAG